MALTRDFKETIQARVERDPAFREALLKEGVGGHVGCADGCRAVPGEGAAGDWRRE